MNYNKKKNLKNHTMHDFFIKNTIIIIIITLFIVDDFQMYKLKCENYNNLQYIYTYIKIHKS